MLVVFGSKSSEKKSAERSTYTAGISNHMLYKVLNVYAGLLHYINKTLFNSFVSHLEMYSRAEPHVVDSWCALLLLRHLDFGAILWNCKI